MPRVKGKRSVYNDMIEIDVPDEVYASLASLGLSTRLTNIHAGKSYTSDGERMTGIKHGATIADIKAAGPNELTVEREAAKKAVDDAVKSLEDGTASFGGGRGIGTTEQDRIIHDILSKLFRDDGMSPPSKIFESLEHYEKIKSIAESGDPSAVQLLNNIDEEVNERLRLQRMRLTPGGSISAILKKKRVVNQYATISREPPLKKRSRWQYFIL